MVEETDEQGYKLPENGETGWGSLLNENFIDIDDDIRKRVSQLPCGGEGIEEVTPNVEDLVFGGGLFAIDDPEVDGIEEGDGRIVVGNGVEPANIGDGFGVADGRTCSRHTFHSLKNVGSGAKVLGGFLDPPPKRNDPDIDFRTLVGGRCIAVTQVPKEIWIDFTCWGWFFPPWWPPVDDAPPWWRLIGDEVEDPTTTVVTPYSPDDEERTGDDPTCIATESGVFGGSNEITYPFATVDQAGEQTCWINESGDAWLKGGLQVGGEIRASDKSFVETVDADDGQKEVVYTSLESGTPHTEASGVAELEDGRAVVELPDHFGWVTGEDEPLMVQTTPYSTDSDGLVVVERSLERVVVEDLDGTGEYEFAYTVTGTREGREDKQVVREPSASGPGPEGRASADD